MSTALRLTVREYDRMIACGAFDQLGKRVELIRGELREMNPAGPVHDDLIAYLNRWSVSNTSPREIIVRVQSGLSLPELDSQPEPDVLWVKGRRYLDRHPLASDVLLAIEVANSSFEFDRTTKAMLYGQAGIREYWIVDVQDRAVHIYEQPTAHGYKTYDVYGIGANVCPHDFPQARLDIAELFGAGS